MLRRSRRLTKGQFDETMIKGRVFHSPFFLARISETKDLSLSKIAAVAPKKIAKTAVTRNRARRRIYAAVQPLVLAGLNPGVHIILIAKAPLLMADKIGDISVEIKALFVKAGLMR
jgi:ribonuclease P protein component